MKIIFWHAVILGRGCTPTYDYEFEFEEKNQKIKTTLTYAFYQ